MEVKGIEKYSSKPAIYKYREDPNSLVSYLKEKNK